MFGVRRLDAAMFSGRLDALDRAHEGRGKTTIKEIV